MYAGIVCFDLDGTLLKGEPLIELAKRRGVETKVAEITRRAMRGECDFEQALYERLQLLKGTPLDDIRELAETMPFNEGALSAIQRLRARNCVTGIITGGFDYVAERVVRRLGLEFYVGNTFEVENDVLTGNARVRVAENKGDLLGFIARLVNRNAPTFAIGDGGNDRGMLESADCGIAFCAGDFLRQYADYCIEERDLRRVVPIVTRYLRRKGVYDGRNNQITRVVPTNFGHEIDTYVARRPNVS